MYVAIKESSKPTTLRSSGTRKPLVAATWITWLAMISEEAKTPSVEGLSLNTLSINAV